MQTGNDPFLSDMPRLKYVLRGIKLEEAKEGKQPPKRLPVTPAILLRIQEILSHNPSDFDNIMLWAAFLLCFFGFLRSGEITIPNLHSYDPTVHLNFTDIATDNLLPPKIIQIKIKASKTDPFRHGVSICIGRSNNSLCPVAALLAYLSIRGTNPGLLFHFNDNTPLTKPRFTAKFRELLKKSGFNDAEYAGHSFRIGAATTAAAKGVEDSLIQTLGRWKSSAYLSYIRIPPSNLAAMSQILAS